MAFFLFFFVSSMEFKSMLFSVVDFRGFSIFFSRLKLSQGFGFYWCFIIFRPEIVDFRDSIICLLVQRALGLIRYIMILW